jgi:hypothetical protein
VLAALGLAVGLALFASERVSAQTGQAPRFFLALASGSQETPSVDTPATAFGRFIHFPDRNLLFYEIRMSPMKGAFTAMHLHRGVAGQAGGVVYPLAAPVGDLSIGVVDFKPEDVATLQSQGFYLNIHSQAHPGGEMRGQVVPSPSAGSPISNP